MRNGYEILLRHCFYSRFKGGEDGTAFPAQEDAGSKEEEPFSANL